MNDIQRYTLPRTKYIGPKRMLARLYKQNPKVAFFKCEWDKTKGVWDISQHIIKEQKKYCGRMIVR